VYTDELGRGSINVESIGGNLIIQHYRAVRTDPSDVEKYSAASTVYLLHLIPVAASVRWLLTVTSTTASASEFTCTVEVQLHPRLRAMGRLMALGTVLKRHVDEETGGFAADITRKCRALQVAWRNTDGHRSHNLEGRSHALSLGRQEENPTSLR
jgi:hypothetical protein